MPGSLSDQYAATAIDWPRLNRYARKVALSTHVVPASGMTWSGVTVVGEHWVLFQSTHNIEGNDRGKISEYNEQKYWLLQRDGALLIATRWNDFVLFPGGQTKRESDLTVRPMQDADVTRLDHADPPGNERGDQTARWWGNREPGRLVRHAKGVGLSLVLKRLAEGQA